jgi:hypothetical protein
VPKKLELPIEKKTLNLFEGDAATLADAYPSIGWSVAVRQLVHVHAKKLREKLSRSGVRANDRAEINDLAASIDIGDVLASAEATGDTEPD